MGAINSWGMLSNVCCDTVFGLFQPFALSRSCLEVKVDSLHNSPWVRDVVSCSGQPLGVTDVAPDVVALVSHATQECLHGLLVKLSVMAAHRKAAIKVPPFSQKPI